MKLGASAICLVCLFWLQGCQATTVSPLEARCRELGQVESDRMKRDSPGEFLALKTDSFYSKSLGTCVFTEVPERGTSTLQYRIVDLSHLFLKDSGLILHCDKDGADSVVVDEVRKLDGYTSHVPFAEWLDNGFGAPARSVKAPGQPYTSAVCELVFEKWMKFLKE